MVVGTETTFKHSIINLLQLQERIAPQHCLQYYLQHEGFFQTFNYEMNSKFILKKKRSYFVSVFYHILDKCLSLLEFYCPLKNYGILCLQTLKQIVTICTYITDARVLRTLILFTLIT